MQALDKNHCWYVAMENNGGLTKNDLGIPNNSTALDSTVVTMTPFQNEMDVEFGGGLDDDSLPPLNPSFSVGDDSDSEDDEEQEAEMDYPTAHSTFFGTHTWGNIVRKPIEKVHSEPAKHPTLNSVEMELGFAAILLPEDASAEIVPIPASPAFWDTVHLNKALLSGTTGEIV